ncbi:MAG: hypothetical protein J6S00_02485, partial [Clostridia bacterium]|nr:hypothetical protein [Clostridia bacterium]
DSGAGVGGRVALNEKETGYTTGVISYIRQTKVPAINRINNDLGPHGTAIDKDEAGKYYTWQGVNDYHTIKTIYDGNHFTYYYGTEIIYDHTSDVGKCTCTNAACILRNNPPATGYPAVIGFGAAARVKSFYVYLNTNELAPASAVDFYNVSYATPAIPMNVNTAVDLNYINVEMDANGTIATASEIVWDSPVQKGVYLNKETNKVSVYTAGTYKLTATAGGVTKNVWVVAKTQEDEHFYLVNMPELNRNSFIESDWRIFSSMNNTDINISEAISAAQLSVSGAYVETAHKFGEEDDLKKGGTLVYVNEIFNDFGDYTVESSMASNGAATIDGVGAGVGGRVTLNEKETGYTTGILSYIRQSKVAAITRTNNDFGPHGTAISKESDGKYYTWQGSADYHTIKTVYNGNEFSFHYDTETIYEYNKTPGTCTCSNNACVFKHTIPSKGYPALVGFGAATRFRSFYVYLNSDDKPDAVAPDAESDENFGYDAANLKVPVNTVFDLADVVLSFGNDKILASKANVDNVRTAVGEVSNGKFVAYKVGEVTATANYNGTTTSFTIKVVDDDTATVETVAFADNTISVEPIISDETDSAYYVTVTPENGKELAPLGLTINENGTVIDSYQTVGNTGNKFRFETLAIELVTITANFIESDVIAAAPLGATIRLADAANGVKTGIKFGNRVNVVTNNGSATALKNTANIKIGDDLIENVTIKEVGTLIIPTVLADGEISVTTPYARKAKATLVTESTEQYADITAVLVDIPEDQYNLAISARAYVAYTVAGDSTVQYYYGDVIERTYNTVYTAAQPARHYYNASTGKYGNLVIDDGSIPDNTATTINVELLLDGGTDHYLIPAAKSDDISYKVGETVTYSFRIKGNYKLKYTVYKDDAEDNLYGNETIKVDTQNDPKTNKYVKSGVYAGEVLKFSTQMYNPGAIQVKLEVLDEADKVVSTFKHTVIVDFDNIGPAVEAPTYYYDENGNQVNSTVAEFYQSSKNEWSAMLEKIQAEVDSDAFQAYWSAKTAGAVYDGTYIYAKREADVNGFLLYDIQLATEEPSKVLAGATKVSDIFATTTNNKFLYNDHTVRPSSFNLTLKAGAAEGSLGITGGFQGYGDASTAAKSTSNKVLYVNMNSHGILNNEASSYYTAIHKV